MLDFEIDKQVENSVHKDINSHLCSCRVVEVLQEPRCVSLMAEFIKKFPGLWFEDIGVEKSEQAH